MGNIEKRGPNTWRIGERTSVAQGRQWVRETLHFPESMSEAEQRRSAKKALAKLQASLDDGTVAIAKPLTVTDMAEKWMTQHVIPNCTPTTAKTYRNLLDKRILPDLGDLKLKQLTPLRINEFIVGLKDEKRTLPSLPEGKRKRPPSASDLAKRTTDEDKHLTPRTVRHYYDVLKFMLNKAVQWDLLKVNPLDKVDRPKVRKTKPKALTNDRAVELLRCLQHDERIPFRAAVLLALLCGLRLGEVGGLYFDDIDWSEATINIDRALHYAPNKGNYLDLPKSDAGVRIISLPAGMLALLRSAQEYHTEAAALIGDRWRGDGRIICSWDGGPLHHDTPSKWFRSFADKNGFEDITFHQLRATHASLLFANNLDAIAVATRMGHSDPATTLRNYGASYRLRDHQAASVMQDIFEASIKSKKEEI